MLCFGERLFRWEARRGSPSLGDDHLRRTYAAVTPATRRSILHLYRATDPTIFAGADDTLRALGADRPSLALWGADDPYIAPRWADELGFRRRVILPGIGHWTPVEAPDEVADRLLALFAEAAP